jgi:hypothetical protein
MFRLPKLVLSYGAVAVATGILMLAAPRAVHAIAATLVQVTNTSANPAVTQDTSRQASQIVNLACQPVASFTGVGCLQLDSHGNFGHQSYAVPSSTSFVLTSLDYWPNGAAPGSGYLQILDQTNATPINSAYEFVAIANFSMPFTIQFPSGIVVGSTAQPAIVSSANFGPYIFLHGYLTSN